MLVDSGSGPCSNAPRQHPSAPWLSPPSGLWPSGDSPPVSPLVEMPDQTPRCQKRPRLERDERALRPMKRIPKRQRSPGGSPLLTPPCPPSRFWRRSDIRDMGIVPVQDPTPMSESIYHVRGGPCASGCPQHLLPSPLPPINLNSPHIPVLQPTINRRTLQELDLNAILRNPQLRHDLLFDSGLQFRPTSGRRKRELSERYWNAVTRELETGCTCVSFDMGGKPASCVCVCRRVTPIPSHPVVALSTTRRILTLRMPSRIRPLLVEFLDLLVCVIQPLSGISGYVSSATLQSQMQQHAAQTCRLRSIFDPDLIEQEIKHGVFDPSGLFEEIGEVLKAHCAPMRDQAVETMVAVAQSCAPGGDGTKHDAIRAIRLCLDILEHMKLDIANHQLQTLRPFLIETSGQFELKAFGRRKIQVSVDVTKAWLQAAHQRMVVAATLPHAAYPLSTITYSSLNRTMKAYLCALEGLTELVFNPPSRIPLSQLSHTGPVLSSSTALPDYPETSFLDSARLVTLGAEAADTTVMYMFLMLYRQLVFFDPSTQPSSSRVLPKVTDADLAQLKTEIRDVATHRLGYCFTRADESTADDPQLKALHTKEWERWQKSARDIVLQIAMRATHVQARAKSPSAEFSPLTHAPDPRMLQLAERWLETNLCQASALGGLLRKRLREAVFHRVVATAFPARDNVTGKIRASVDDAPGRPAAGSATGMEALLDEIRGLGDKLTKLSLIHLGVYLPLYEQVGFIQD
ncbi:Tcp11-domain-containing protein [Athelia psychrophila]|uniref:Tcp11-domain-containing protein n=1 Tax=Athelia psychrophila TaxID=1759441 RepID=A0A166WBT5_9AGAM|nr:Tcp11-domain-containing protein [Fibularhizoctonia sp. CBS 109695]